ncbi:MAG: hypothetical protein HY812_14700 [Planctomycetes bacterium]|nr:hypothetical protein [Planctomycetota bacterium]
MFARLPAICLFLLASSAPCQEGPGEEAASPEALYERSLRRVVEVAQRRLEEASEVFQDHSTFDKAWEVRTRHYLVKTTHSRRMAQEVADGLETMLGHFQTLLDTDWVPPEHFRVFIFLTIQDYNAFGEQFGAEHSSFYGSFYAGQHPEQPVAAVFRGSMLELQMEVTHSAFHQYLEQAKPSARQLPLAFSEGLAAYFALYWAPVYCREQHQHLAESNRFIPLRRLAAANLEQFNNNAHETMMELGCLFTYLRWHRAGTRIEQDAEGKITSEPFSDFIRVVVDGGDSSGLETAKLLNERAAELEKDFREFRFPE